MLGHLHFTRMAITFQPRASLKIGIFLTKKSLNSLQIQIQYLHFSVEAYFSFLVLIMLISMPVNVSKLVRDFNLKNYWGCKISSRAISHCQILSNFQIFHRCKSTFQGPEAENFALALKLKCWVQIWGQNCCRDNFLYILETRLSVERFIIG